MIRERHSKQRNSQNKEKQQIARNYRKSHNEDEKKTTRRSTVRRQSATVRDETEAL